MVPRLFLNYLPKPKKKIIKVWRVTCQAFSVWVTYKTRRQKYIILLSAFCDFFGVFLPFIMIICVLKRILHKKKSIFMQLLESPIPPLTAAALRMIICKRPALPDDHFKRPEDGSKFSHLQEGLPGTGPENCTFCIIMGNIYICYGRGCKIVQSAWP